MSLILINLVSVLTTHLLLSLTWEISHISHESHHDQILVIVAMTTFTFQASSNAYILPCQPVYFKNMMTSSHGNFFRVTGHLCGEFTGDRWIPRTEGQWRVALVFSLICAWINGRVNNGEAGDLRRHRAHYDTTVMTHVFCSQLDKPRLFLVATNRVHVNIVVIINAIVLYILVFMYLLEIKLLLLLLPHQPVDIIPYRLLTFHNYFEITSKDIESSVIIGPQCLKMTTVSRRIDV